MTRTTTLAGRTEPETRPTHGQRGGLRERRAAELDQSPASPPKAPETPKGDD